MALADIFTRTEGAGSARPTAAPGGTVRTLGELPTVQGEGMAALRAWVDEIAALTQPARVHWVDGSRAENDALLREMVDEGKLIKLNPEWRPGSYLARSHPSDVARTEARTFIASEREEDAGPTNNWAAPDEIRATITPLFEGSMRGRTMYVVPFSMGPVGGPLSHIGVQVTDSAYAVTSIGIMTRVGTDVLREIAGGAPWVKTVHSVGAPLQPGEQDVAWPCNDEKYIVHFPDTLEVWSFGSGYGGNAILAKKCFALRIASVIGRNEGWLAEHMLLIRVIDPAGRAYHLAAAFPSACGKTNLAMLRPTIPGWRVETLGDDIAWLRPGDDGRLWAINPEAGFFGVAPGTGESTNVDRGRDALGQHDLHERRAASRRRRLVGGTHRRAAGRAHRLGGQPLDAGIRSSRRSPELALHGRAPPSARRSPTTGTPRRACRSTPSCSAGGARRTCRSSSRRRTGPTASSWARTSRPSARPRPREPSASSAATRSRCCPSAATTWPTTSPTGSRSARSSGSTVRPAVFQVNWFRKGSDGRFLWPGFGDNSRVIDWIIRRIEGEVGAVESPIGRLPRTEDLDLDGLDVSQDDLDELFAVDPQLWLQEADLTEEFYRTFEGRVPAPLWAELAALRYRLQRA